MDRNKVHQKYLLHPVRFESLNLNLDFPECGLLIFSLTYQTLSSYFLLLGKKFIFLLSNKFFIDEESGPPERKFATGTSDSVCNLQNLKIIQKIHHQ